MPFKYNERQFGVTLRAVDIHGEQQTLLLSTSMLRIEDVGDTRGAHVSSGGESQFFFWPMEFLNQFVPPKTFYNSTCWSIGSDLFNNE
jgi:hypothetical protein